MFTDNLRSLLCRDLNKLKEELELYQNSLVEYQDHGKISATFLPDSCSLIAVTIWLSVIIDFFIFLFKVMNFSLSK